MKKMFPIALSLNKNLAFCGVFWDGDIISQKTPKENTESFKWTEEAVPVGEREAMITDVAVIDDVVYASAVHGRIWSPTTIY